MLYNFLHIISHTSIEKISFLFYYRSADLLALNHWNGQSAKSHNLFSMFCPALPSPCSWACLGWCLNILTGFFHVKEHRFYSLPPQMTEQLALFLREDPDTLTIVRYSTGGRRERHKTKVSRLRLTLVSGGRPQMIFM